MFTIRNIGGISLFLFGTTFLWLTPAFASRGADTTGFWWGAARVLSFAALAGFSIATYGLFQKNEWWGAVAVGAAGVGTLALVPYWIAAHASGEPSPWWNVLIHFAGSAGVVVLLTVPVLQRWVDAHVMSGR